MIHSTQSFRGSVVAPHHLAAQAGLRVLQDGGNAIEAIIAAAATIAIVYPHMNSIGGDGFWLISKPGEPPFGIDACGGAAQMATRDFYKQHGLAEIPSRGPLAALTVAGTVAGWQLAYEFSGEIGGRLPLSRLLEDAIFFAKDGTPVSVSQVSAIAAKADELRNLPGFADSYFPEGNPPRHGGRQRQARLAAMLERLVTKGLSDFYEGEIARSIAEDLEQLGSPLRYDDLASYAARKVVPLSLNLSGVQILNMPPPTQGLASLLILGVFDKLKASQADGFDHIHGLVEATKQAFRIRDAHVTDPAYMAEEPSAFLADDRIDAMAARIDPEKALAWQRAPAKGDTIWMGVIDSQGCAVSFIQSTYWEFGSGVVLPATGLVWQNRGMSFSLNENALNRLEPDRKPFHTLNPAMAFFSDGRRMVYGAMGGDGQPQTQAALFTRYARFSQDLQHAISAPRWVLGRTWGADSTMLKIEDRFDPALYSELERTGHDVEVIEPFSETMGHAGAIVRHETGLIEAASDPRSDGRAASY